MSICQSFSLPWVILSFFFNGRPKKACLSALLLCVNPQNGYASNVKITKKTFSQGLRWHKELKSTCRNYLQHEYDPGVNVCYDINPIEANSHHQSLGQLDLGAFGVPPKLEGSYLPCICRQPKEWGDPSNSTEQIPSPGCRGGKAAYRGCHATRYQWVYPNKWGKHPTADDAKASWPAAVRCILLTSPEKKTKMMSF